jgi:hypothetical protein
MLPTTTFIFHEGLYYSEGSLEPVSLDAIMLENEMADVWLRHAEDGEKLELFKRELEDLRAGELDHKKLVNLGLILGAVLAGGAAASLARAISDGRRARSGTKSA